MLGPGEQEWIQLAGTQSWYKGGNVWKQTNAAIQKSLGLTLRLLMGVNLWKLNQREWNTLDFNYLEMN